MRRSLREYDHDMKEYNAVKVGVHPAFIQTANVIRLWLKAAREAKSV